MLKWWVTIFLRDEKTVMVEVEARTQREAFLKTEKMIGDQLRGKLVLIRRNEWIF